MSAQGRRGARAPTLLSPSRDTKRGRNVNCAQDKSIVLRYPVHRKYIRPRGLLTAGNTNSDIYTRECGRFGYSYSAIHLRPRREIYKRSSQVASGLISATFVAS